MTTTPTPKYRIGQKVWRVDECSVISNVITGVYRNTEGNIFYCFIGYSFDSIPEKEWWDDESNVFPSKQSLIKSL